MNSEERMINTPVGELVQQFTRREMAEDISHAADLENEQQLAELLQQHRISPDEYRSIHSIIGRSPTLCELGIFSSMWSEHCSYKSTRRHLKKLPTEAPWVVQGPGENAGIIRFDKDLCIAFKMESHNHPSYIEPYQGAATGVGGIMRDVFCMGARPVANINCLRFGEKSHPRTHYLLEQVVKGIGDYGNCVGVPTVNGNVSFDKSYNGNCLVNAMTVGLVNEKHIFKGYASGIGNLVVYVGSATGKDGIHGATMASDSFSSENSESRTTIQVGDPFTEKQLLEATLEVIEKNLVVGLQDMGAAGLTSSSFEMASRAQNGIYLDLDAVPVRTAPISAYELMLSESQERMLMVVEPSKWPQLQEVFEKWELSYAVIGKVIGGNSIKISYQGKAEVDLPFDDLVEKAPNYDRPYESAPLAKPMLERNKTAVEEQRKSQQSQLQQWMQSWMSKQADTRSIYDQYDHHIGARSHRTSVHGGAAVMWIGGEYLEEKGDGYDGQKFMAISSACLEDYCAINAHYGAAYSVLKCARMIACTGGIGKAITDCMNFGNPEIPAVMGQFVDAVSGISEACENLQTPVIGGNVSLYNETDGASIKPTPMIGMVGIGDQISRCPKAVIENQGQYVYLMTAKGIFSRKPESHEVVSFEKAGVPYAINWEVEKAAMDCLQKLIAGNAVHAAREISQTGFLPVLGKMLAATGMSFKWDADGLNTLKDWMFQDIPAAYLIASEQPLAIESNDQASSKVELVAIGRSLKSHKPAQIISPIEKDRPGEGWNFDLSAFCGKY